jgi:SAM-dependent methyltransferase
MIGDERYRRKLRHRARGIDELDRRVGGVCAEIDARLAHRDVVRVLELGCGYGTALLELRARYGRRVELHGINRQHEDGDLDILRRSAAERGLIGDPPADIAWPAIAYGDVAAGLPFADGSFDLVYSQVAWLYFGNKIGVIRDVMRILSDDGVAKIEADEVRAGLPLEYARLVEIWEEGALLPFGAYLRRFGMALANAPDGVYLRFGKAAAFGDDLVRVLEIDLSTLYAHWDGVKCVYARSAIDSTTPSATSASMSASP